MPQEIGSWVSKEVFFLVVVFFCKLLAVLCVCSVFIMLCTVYIKSFLLLLCF